MRAGLGAEPYILPRWKRQPIGYKPESDAHSTRTQFLRRDYNAADVGYLQCCVTAQQAVSADEANRILRTMKPDTSRSKRAPAEADPDPDLRAEFRARPERRMTAEDLAREQFTGRALSRELARIGRKP